MATNNKYDRQIRLWGAQGQRLLAESQILLLGAGAAGVEAVKNLVLPGCGHFTVVDEYNVTERDLGNNFFCSPEYLNQSRAKSVTENLVEMNPDDVKGTWIQESVTVKALDEEFLKTFSIVIANEVMDETLIQLSEICQRNGIKLASIQTNGFYGQLALQAGSHCIVESKPEREFFDWTLRIQEPFKLLEEFANNFDITELSSQEDKAPLAHVPYLVILVKAVSQWKSSHEGKLPSSTQDRTEVSEIVKSQMLKLEAKDRENFEEAISHLYWSYKNSRGLPDNLETVFEHAYCLDLKSAPLSQLKFWVLVAALKQFRVNNGNFLPVDRRIPDMKSTTEWFIALKDVYQRQHNADKQAFVEILNQVNLSNGLNLVFDEREDIQVFLDNIYCLDFLPYRSISAQLQSPLETENYDNTAHLWYVGQRAVNAFYSKNKRFPSPTDVVELAAITQEIQSTRFQNYIVIAESIVKEFCRFEDTKLHNIAAILGGTASQEIIKLLTHQFVPINNTFIFNGITSEAIVLEF